MAAMKRMMGLGLLAASIVAPGLASVGCVPAEQHRAALADLQRLRVEAWQRSVEAAALRTALDRAAAENAQLRGYAQGPSPAMLALAARLDAVAQKQDAMIEQMRSTPACTAAPAGATVPASAQQGGQTPPARKVTDLLYSRF